MGHVEQTHKNMLRINSWFDTLLVSIHVVAIDNSPTLPSSSQWKNSTMNRVFSVIQELTQQRIP